MKTALLRRTAGGRSAGFLSAFALAFGCALVASTAQNSFAATLTVTTTKDEANCNTTNSGSPNPACVVMNTGGNNYPLSQGCSLREALQNIADAGNGISPQSFPECGNADSGAAATNTIVLPAGNINVNEAVPDPGDSTGMAMKNNGTLPFVGDAATFGKVIVTGGKTALFDVLDAATGAFVFSSDLGVQNIVTAVDPHTGEKTTNPALEPEVGKPKLMCPNSIGARNWQSTALDPDTGVLFVPILENCADYTYSPGSAAQTAKGGIDIHFGARVPPNHDGNFGRLVALDLRKRKILWTHRQRLPLASSALATAGGLVFLGDVDRNFAAYDARTGNVLWQTRLSAPAESFPVTYAVNHQQYIAVVAGGGSPMGAASRAFVPEVTPPAAGVTLIVFAQP